MTVLYFDEAEVGKLRTGGPYLVSSSEIIELPKSTTRSLSTSMRKRPRARSLPG